MCRTLPSHEHRDASPGVTEGSRRGRLRLGLALTTTAALPANWRIEHGCGQGPPRREKGLALAPCDGAPDLWAESPARPSLHSWDDFLPASLRDGLAGPPLTALRHGGLGVTTGACATTKQGSRGSSCQRTIAGKGDCAAAVAKCCRNRADSETEAQGRGKEPDSSAPPGAHARARTPRMPMEREGLGVVRVGGAWGLVVSRRHQRHHPGALRSSQLPSPPSTSRASRREDA